VRQGVTMRGAYFPRGLWYSPYDGALAVDATDGGRYVNLTVRSSWLQWMVLDPAMNLRLRQVSPVYPPERRR